MNRPVHFEIHAENPERAIAFYQELFGWQFQKVEGPMEYWLIMTGDKDTPGINGGLLRRQGKTPNPKDPTPVIAWVGTVDVADVDKTIKAATNAGAAIAVPKTAMTGLAWLAYLKDTEGNIFGVFQADTNAK